MKLCLAPKLMAVASVISVFAFAAQAQATRTWVSGVGDDVNPCSRTAPCKTFAGAISNTAIDGEIDALDPGGFGAVTITKSITIDGTGTFASILASGFTGVIINLSTTTAEDPRQMVRLRGLSINGAGPCGVSCGTNTGVRGINILGTTPTVILEDVVIDGFINEGIFWQANGGELMVRNCSIRNNSTKGIMLKSGGANLMHASISNSSLTFNQEGLRAETNARVAVRDSSISNNALNGIVILTVGGPAEINVADCLVASNKAWGITVDAAGGSAIVRITNVTVVGSTGFPGAQGLRSVNGGQILSAGNNVIDGNAVNGTITGPVAKQ